MPTRAVPAAVAAGMEELTAAAAKAEAMVVVVKAEAAAEEATEMAVGETRPPFALNSPELLWLQKPSRRQQSKPLPVAS